jgi:tetratricopeptide (TPR) repeat protein
MFKPARSLASLLLLFALSISYGQNRAADTLMVMLRDPKIHDTIKLYNIATAIDQRGQFDQKTKHLNSLMGQLALQHYKKNNTAQLHKVYTKYVAAYYNNLGNDYGKKGDVAKTLANLDKSISLFKSVQSYDEMYYAVIGKAVMLSRIYEYEKAISSLFAALRYFESDKNANADAISYVQSTLASIYSDQGRHDQSIAFNQKVIQYHRNLKSLTAEQEFQISTAYANCGSSYLALKKYPEALDNFNRALLLLQKLGDQTNISVVLTKIARVQMEESKLDAAESTLNQALKSGISDMALANANVKFGELYYRKKDYAKADSYLTKGLSLSQQTENLGLQEQASGLLLKVSEQRNDFKKAFEMQRFHDRLTDSSKTETARNILAQQQLKYDFEKKELNYQLATASKNNLLLGLSGVLVVLVLGGYFYFRNNKQRQAISALEKNQMRQKLLLSQMNPHFIFNSLQNIRSLIRGKQDEAAMDYLGKFSKLTRQVLENSDEDYISLSDEVAMIGNYLTLQQLSGNAFDFKVTVDDTLNPELIFLPPMLTQPFIENAIKHGLSSKEAGGRINVRFYFEANKLFFEVTDNGNGFQPHKKQTGHKSMSMGITRERLAYYAKNRDIAIKADNLKDQDQNTIGAKVSFEIPYIYEN